MSKKQDTPHKVEEHPMFREAAEVAADARQQRDTKAAEKKRLDAELSGEQVEEARRTKARGWFQKKWKAGEEASDLNAKMAQRDQVTADLAVLEEVVGMADADLEKIREDCRRDITKQRWAEYLQLVQMAARKVFEAAEAQAALKQFREGTDGAFPFAEFAHLASQDNLDPRQQISSMLMVWVVELLKQGLITGREDFLRGTVLDKFDLKRLAS